MIRIYIWKVCKNPLTMSINQLSTVRNKEVLWHESEDINEKKAYFQNFSWFQFYIFKSWWLCVFHCSHRLCWIKSCVRIFLWKLFSFHTKMISAKVLWGSVLLRGESRGHSLKICDGYVWLHWPPFSNLLLLNDLLFMIHSVHSPNDPHFLNVLSLNDPILRNKMLLLNDPFFKEVNALIEWDPFSPINDHLSGFFL